MWISRNCISYNNNINIYYLIFIFKGVKNLGK